MSKEYLEALNKIQHDFGQLKGQELVSCYETIFNALKRLEAIDNANPSEALKCLEELRSNLDEIYDDTLNTIEIALLKAKQEHNSLNLLMRELDCKDFADLRKYARCGYEKLNKKYLKWEDLEKFKDKDSVKVKMNDTELSLIIQIDCLNDIYVQLYKEKEDGNCVNLLSDFFRNKELFNNLRLELLE